MKKIFAAAAILGLASNGVCAQRGGSVASGASSAEAVTLKGGAPQETAALQLKMRAAMRQILITPAIANMTGYQVKLYASYGSKRSDQGSLAEGPPHVEGMVGVTRIGGAGDLPNIKLYLNSPILFPSAEWPGEPDVFAVRPEVLSASGIGRVAEGGRLRILITRPNRPVVLPLTKAEAGAMELAGLRRALAAKPSDAYAQSQIKLVEAALAGLSTAKKAERACKGDFRDPAKRYDCAAQPTKILVKLNPAYLAGAPRGAVRSMTVSLDYTSKIDILSAAMEEVDTRALQALLD